MAAPTSGGGRQRRLAALRSSGLGALLALALVAPGAAAPPGPWIGWDLDCETGRFALADESWRWTWIDGLTATSEEDLPLAAVTDRASLLLLLGDGTENRSLYVEARADRGVRSLRAALNGVDLGTRPVRRNWRILEYPIPPGALAGGPNVLALEVIRAGGGAEPAPLLLSRVAVEPGAYCPRAAPVAVDPGVENSLAEDAAIVVPEAWSEPSRLALRMATEWPPTTLEVFCFDGRAAARAAAVSGGPSRRIDLPVALTGECAAAAGLVLVARGPGGIRLRRARLGRLPTPLPRHLGAALALAAVAFAAALAGATAGARRAAGRPAAGSGSAALRAAGGVAARFLASPLAWLLLVLWVAFFSALQGGELWANRVADTIGYENLFLEGADDPFAFSRTPGYPIFLYLSGWELWGIARVTIAHALSYGAAIVLFWYAVRAYLDSGWLALGAALPLVASPLVRIIRRVQPDFMGGVASLVVIALVILLAARERSRGLWLALALAIFAGYQIRPALVFLIGFVPVAALVLRAARTGLRGPGLRRFAAAGLLAALGPFLVYSALRWARVGHFGLVSYGGFNVIGVTSPMLDEELAASLSDDLRPLAEAIVVEKRRAGLPVYEKGTSLEFWYQNYNRHVWSVAVPTARRLYEPDGPRPLGLVEINDRFTALSFAIIARRPGLYLDWVVRCFAEVTGRALREPTIRWPAALFAVAALAAVAGGRRPGSPALERRRRLAALAGLTLVAVGFYVTHLLLIVSVEEALERYYVATVFLIPCALGACLFEAGRRALVAFGLVRSGA